MYPSHTHFLTPLPVYIDSKVQRVKKRKPVCSKQNTAPDPPLRTFLTLNSDYHDTRDLFFSKMIVKLTHLNLEGWACFTSSLPMLVMCRVFVMLGHIQYFWLDMLGHIQFFWLDNNEPCITNMWRMTIMTSVGRGGKDGVTRTCCFAEEHSLLVYSKSS